MMKKRCILGIIASGLIGATGGMYSYRRFHSKYRKRFMPKKHKTFRNISRITDMVKSIHVFK